MVAIIIPSPFLDAGAPFEIGDHVTIWQAARIYVGKHPSDAFFGDGASTARESVETREQYLGKSPEWAGLHPRRYDDVDHQQRESRRTSQSVYEELKRAVAHREVHGAVIYTFDNGEIDTARTMIPIGALLELAQRRRAIFGSWDCWQELADLAEARNVRTIGIKTETAEVRLRKPRRSDPDRDRQIAYRIRQVQAAVRRKWPSTSKRPSDHQMAKLLTSSGKLEGYGVSAVRAIIRGKYRPMHALLKKNLLDNDIRD
jgi:hypothetical protein